MIVSDVESEPGLEQEVSPALYQVGEEVICITLVNNPGYYAPGEKLKADVECVFWNGVAGWTYRVRAELQLEKRGVRCVGKVVMGNISEARLSRASD